MEIALISLRIFASFLMDGIFIGNYVPKIYLLNLKCSECNGNWVNLFEDFHDFFDGRNFHGKLRSKNLFTRFEMFGM